MRNPSYFYPRPPRGGRRALDDFTFGKRSISIHALREEGDGCRLEEDPPHQDFYPRPPRGERPMVDVNNDLLVEISIHALREEGDGGRLLPQPPCAYFYPRPPRGGRPCGGAEGVAICHFYPRPPRGGRPDGPAYHKGRAYFYPRPLRGGRRAKAAIEDADEIFLSTPSARRATHELDHGQRAQVISIHALCEEGDVDRADVPEGVVISIHALCEEGDSALL